MRILSCITTDPSYIEYRLVAKKGEGTFSEVLKAQCIKNGKYVAIKCMKNHFDSLDQVNNLREIQALRRLSPHSNIIKLLEVLYDQPTGRLALVFELMDMNIYELIRGRRHYVAEDRIKIYMYQLAKAMDHMHRNGIFHRDIKPENILIADDVLKLADFGSCRGIYRYACVPHHLFNVVNPLACLLPLFLPPPASQPWIPVAPACLFIALNSHACSR